MTDTELENVAARNVTPIRPLDEAAALAWLKSQPGGRTDLPAAELARRWGWQRYTVTRRLQRWRKDGLVARRGRFIIATDLEPPATNHPQHVDMPPEQHRVVAAPVAGFVAVRNAAREAATVSSIPGATDAAPGTYPARLLEHWPGMPREWRLKLPGERARSAPRFWSAIGRGGVGLAIVATGAFIAFTSMRANSWFGHNLTPDPVAGEVYSHLSVAAEVIACLLPTGIRFYAQAGERWTALRGWVLMAVALAVVFFAAGGFAVTNLNAGVDARAERSTVEIVLAQRRLDTVTKSRAAECVKRGPLCRKLEAEEQAAIASLEQARVDVRQDADPQAAALGISSARLRIVQAGALVALCLFSGLFISFGAGLIWRRPAPSPPESKLGARSG
jgi:hypothetical protein